MAQCAVFDLEINNLVLFGPWDEQRREARSCLLAYILGHYIGETYLPHIAGWQLSGTRHWPEVILKLAYVALHVQHQRPIVVHHYGKKSSARLG